MSAKRRQEAIARFSVPLEEESLEAPVEAPILSRQTRKAKNNNTAVLDDGDEGNDSDFVIDGNESDDYIETNDTPFSEYGNKAKGKGKAKAVLSSRSSLELGSEENPKVMLLSLKAVCAIFYEPPCML